MSICGVDPAPTPLPGAGAWRGGSLHQSVNAAGHACDLVSNAADCLHHRVHNLAHIGAGEIGLSDMKLMGGQFLDNDIGQRLCRLGSERSFRADVLYETPHTPEPRDEEAEHN